MDLHSLLLTLPKDLEVWLILGYIAVVLAGARLAEAVARVHFERARRFAEQGFDYDVDGDHYQCPQGERLSLHLVEADTRMAVYRAPARTCNDCPSKHSCTPHDEGRHIYRPLAAWTETDVGRFHRRVSLLMIAVGLVFSVGGLALWMGKPGTGMLFLALVASLASVARDLKGKWIANEPREV